MLSTTASATAFMVVRRSMAVRWIQRKASGSVRPCRLMSRPLARSMTFGVSSACDEITLAEGGEDDDGRDPVTGDLGRGCDPVQLGHLDIEDHEVGLEIGGEGDGLLAIPGLPDDLIALFAQHFDEVQPDERLVFRDEHP